MGPPVKGVARWEQRARECCYLHMRVSTRPLTLQSFALYNAQEGKGLGATSEGCGVLGAEDALVLLEHCLEAQGSGKGVS